MVTWLTKTFAPEAKGHGVPEVMNAVYYNDRKIVVGTVSGDASWAITLRSSCSKEDLCRVGYPVNIRKLLAGITKQFPGNASTAEALRTIW
jgi:hypothetical protein